MNSSPNGGGCGPGGNLSGSPSARRAASVDEEAYMTVSSAPPKRRAGRTKFHETRHPLFKGVLRRNADRWVCEVREPNKKSRLWLGTFPTAEMAARAHDVAAIALRGRAACLNFSDSAWRLPIPGSSSPHDIQRTALAAAEAFRPSTADHFSPSAAVAAAPPSAVAEGDPFCMDFGMQGYLEMAEGLLIDPPPLPSEEDGNGGVADVSLWSHSI